MRRFRRGGTVLVTLVLIGGITSACVRPPWLSWPGRNGGQEVVLGTGDVQTCALTIVGGVRCWGRNIYGTLGDGTTTDRFAPVDVVGLSHGVTAVSVGWNHACAITDAGGVKCWGYNLRGQLGDGTTITRTTPVDVVGLAHGVKAVSAGIFHTCALTTAGAVRCWGLNQAGQLGDGTTVDSPTPVDVVGLGSGVRAVTAGIWHSCAITSAGGARCWGQNNFGQVGDGTTVNRSTPVAVAGLSSGVTGIDAGSGGSGPDDGSHTCAVVSGGVRCWGINAAGQLGDGTTTTRLTPVPVLSLGTGAATVATGSGYTCALRTSGAVACWGFNAFGQLGDGTTVDRSTPAPVVGLSSGVTDLATGGFHACVLTRSGGVKCWGGNFYGQVGDGQNQAGGPNQDTSVPVDVSGSFYRLECPTLSAAPQTDFSLTNGYGRGSVATFTAGPGYALAGAATLTCGPHQTWDGTPPSAVTTGRVVVTPSTGLIDGQSVDVSLSGFAPAATLGWCQAVVASVPAGPGLCGGPIRTGTADANGALVDPAYPLARNIYVPALGRSVDCADPAERCVLAAADVRDIAASAATAPLAFTPSP
jgi:alpha-tubulin suppressor-like RCC1 family protein